ncbi:AI-2E family transporter [Marinifilum caeruleilacunae]|uniref:AI-2E family transporter n=1 Tax=Marinifilum caeruleilacunae TaxID=2499076 RepID=A0ABX1WW07_9BACT|nr:AI-2E family transporter [Marinifilum caeruleilacunae]NOU60121.1 AI-2E family transporter [Marinifilum caeruleilacunae]
MLSKYKHEIILTAFVVLSAIAFFYLYGYFLPFVIGLLLAFACLPAIEKIQKLVKSRELASFLFLAGIMGIFVLSLVFFAGYVNKDFKRVNQSFHVLISDNKSELESIEQKVKTYVGEIYQSENLEMDFEAQVDTLKAKLGDNLDTETISSAFGKITSVFQTDSEVEEKDDSESFGFLYILYSSLLYFVLILFNFDYFISLKARYFKNKIESKFQMVLDDFNRSFFIYFKLRTKIVLILSLLYILVFSILNLPGIIMFTLLIIILSYIPYLQYLSLIPIALSCLVLSIENEHGFLFYYGIVIATFIVASIIEELLLNPFIMEKNIGLNPVIMVLALSVWGYTLGTPGLLIGIPLTILIVIFIKRYVLESYEYICLGKKEEVSPQ